MSRRNNVTGPTSALTEFLRESGITPRTVARRVRTREVQQPVAGPSNSADQDGGGQEEQETPARTTRANVGAEGYASDHLDDSEEEKPAPKKRKLTKAAEAKLKAQEKAKAKGKGKKKDDDDEYENSEGEDAYTALSKMWKDTSKPPVGSFENCAKCSKQFTVTKYTIAANPPPGFLCHLCAKASGADPFKKPAAPRKRKTAGERRVVTHFEERRFPSLASLCIQMITSHINDVDSLGDIGSLNVDELAKALSRNRALTSENASLFYDAGNKKLTFYDATNLTTPAFCTLAALNPNLTALRLEFCGRIDDSVMDVWAKSLPNLKHLELLGPFLLRPPAWQIFLEGHPGLESFLITQSPRFDIECMKSLADNCRHIKALRLKEIGKMDDSFLTEIKKFGEQLTYLDLSYPGISDSLTEEAVVDMLSTVCGTLTHLDLSNNRLLTNGVLLQGLKPYAKHLISLTLANVPELTDAGVADFFEAWNTANSPPNPSLMELDLSRCHELGAAALKGLLKHSGPALTNLNINGWKAVSEEALRQIGVRCPELRKLDIGWCREVDDWVIKDLVENCEYLEEIKVWGCQRLTEKCPRKRNVNVCGVETHYAF